MGMSREARWAERWKWKECQRRLLFWGWLQSRALEPLALAASHTALTCLEAASASLPTPQALPQLGIFPDIIWQLWEGESFSLRSSECPRLSPLCRRGAGGWFGSGLVPQPEHLPVHDLAVGEVGIARHCHRGSRRMKRFHFVSSPWLG